MKGSPLTISIISLILVLGTLLAGCTQNSSSSQTQSSANVVTTEQTTMQPGNVGQTETPVAKITEIATQTSYSISVTVNRQDPSTIVVTYQGGQSAAYLQHITVLVNGALVGTLSPPSGATFLPIGTSGTFNATANSHIVLFGHFLGASAQSVFDSTV
jgi:hypothetical protein